MAFTDLTDEEWEDVRGLIRPRAKKGRPRGDERRTLNAILFVLQEKIPWNYLPSEYGNDSTPNRRLKEWEEDGTWDRIADALGLVEDSDLIGEPGSGDSGLDSGLWDVSQDYPASGRGELLCPARPRITIARGDAPGEAIGGMTIISCTEADTCLPMFHGPVGGTRQECIPATCFLFVEGEDGFPGCALEVQLVSSTRRRAGRPSRP